MRTFLFVLLLLSLIACTENTKISQNHNFTVNGTIENAPVNTVIKLYKRTSNNIEIQDTVVLTNGDFELKGKTSELDFFVIEFNNTNNFIYLLADSNDNITINADFYEIQNYNVNNSVHSELVQVLENNLFSTNKKITQAIDSGEDFSEIENNQLEFSKDFISKYDTSLAVIIAFSQKFITGETILPIDSFYNDFKKAEINLAKNYSQIDHYNQFCLFIKNHEAVVSRNQNVTQLQVQPDNLQDFTATTLTGETFTLSTLQGEWILLNFWASWSPNANENNTIISEIAENFEEIKIVQISIDANEQILKDVLANYNFNHVLINDVLAWSSPIVNLYAVDMLPTFILINPTGEIELYTNLTSEIILEIEQLK